MPHRDPEAQAAYRKKYYEVNKLKLQQQQREYQARTKEARAAVNKARYERKKSEIRLKQKEYADLNREQLREQSRLHRAANKERLNREAKGRYHREKVAKSKERLLAGAKGRAKERGIDFTITVDSLSWPDVCPVLGFTLSYNGQSANRESRASLDRLDPSMGYTAENTRVISSRANRIKSDATLTELEALMQYIKNANVLS